MQVSGVRSIKVFDESNQPLAIDVEVEPRNIHTKSHQASSYALAARMSYQDDLSW